MDVWWGSLTAMIFSRIRQYVRLLFLGMFVSWTVFSCLLPENAGFVCDDLFFCTALTSWRFTAMLAVIHRLWFLGVLKVSVVAVSVIASQLALSLDLAVNWRRLGVMPFRMSVFVNLFFLGVWNVSVVIHCLFCEVTVFVLKREVLCDAWTRQLAILKNFWLLWTLTMLRLSDWSMMVSAALLHPVSTLATFDKVET